MQRRPAPSLIRTGPNEGIMNDLRRFANFARNNPLATFRS
jgi:hypothetical protein